MATWKRIITDADDSNYKNSNVKSSDLPVATASAVGGIKVGSNLSIVADGTLSASSGSNTTNSSMAFNTSTGVLTLTDSASGSVTVDLDGRFPTDKITNLSISGTTGALTIASSTGTNAVIPIQSGNNSGLMDKTRDTAITANSAKVSNVSTNLSVSTTNAKVTVNSSDGTNAEISTANGSNAGVLSSALFNAINTNTAKTSNVTTNLSVSTSAGKVTVASSDGTNAEIGTATASSAGVLSSTLFSNIQTNNAKVSASGIVSCTESNVISILGALDSSDTLHIGDTGADTTVSIRGNLTVSGTTTTVDSTNLKIGDNLITLNKDVTGTPTENAGFEVERGTSANPNFIWSESSDHFMIDYNSWKANVATMQTANSSAPTSSDNEGGATGAFWHRTGTNEVYVRTA